MPRHSYLLSRSTRPARKYSIPPGPRIPDRSRADEGTAVSVWAVAPSILVLGVGMGACISSIYDVAIG
jgi:hypothetical protein